MKQAYIDELFYTAVYSFPHTILLLYHLITTGFFNDYIINILQAGNIHKIRIFKHQSY